MPLAPRIEFAGAIYHVMNRGNHLEPIVRDEKDRYLLARWTRGQTKVGLKWLTQKVGVRTSGALSYGIWNVIRQTEKNPKLKKKWKLLQN